MCCYCKGVLLRVKRVVFGLVENNALIKKGQVWLEQCNLLENVHIARFLV